MSQKIESIFSNRPNHKVGCWNADIVENVGDEYDYIPEEDFFME